ncbi:tRNA threonylcarbamoyladenosine dehydratase [uncultured Flavobacterium sp.]|uniref:tRNA threonylcarbamoyladenosine dehydratase n=1 Tax=uncultured Flavobacterium sp. TaxID=165435 RepID=UPI0030ED2BFE|tara:strand:+ start:796 stop:1512 length:717 start_codon:yes stop_codon:yes gene_type:complete
MAQWQERAELLFKEEGINKLKNANLLVVGLGGVGSFAAEFLVRAGIGKMTIVDGDTVDITNINRQLPALHSTIGKTKVDIVANRLLDINPDLNLTKVEEFLSPERATEIVTTEYDYVLDCIDSVTPKLNLIISAKRRKVKVISCMGAGGKYDSSKVFVKDISKTKDCPLAKNIRKRLKRVKINKGVKAVFSTEIPEPTSLKKTDGKNYKKSFYGTNSWMPALFGLQAAETVVRYLLEK